MTLPQIIGFGAQKAGTTWLFDNLATNPGIWRPPLKEMHLFNHQQDGGRWMLKDHRQRLREQREAALRRGKRGVARNFNRLLQMPMLTEEWYRTAYAPCPEGLQSIDITPAYAMLDGRGHDHMANLLGTEFKGIYLIRDPAARAISAVTREMVGETRLDGWMERIRSQTVLTRSDYRSAIQMLDDRLGDRVLYLPFKMVKADPVNLLRAVELHCGLPEGEYKAAEKASHVSPRTPFPDGLHDAVRELLRDQYDWLTSRFGPGYLGFI